MSQAATSAELIVDHPLCAGCGLCCLPWQHKPGAPKFYPCAYLTPRGCALTADKRPDACREFACKRLRAAVSSEEFSLPMGRDEEWLVALFSNLLGAKKAQVPEWYRPAWEANLRRRKERQRMSEQKA